MIYKYKKKEGRNVCFSYKEKENYFIFHIIINNWNSLFIYKYHLN